MSEYINFTWNLWIYIVYYRNGLPMLVFHSSLRTRDKAPNKVSFWDNSSKLSGFLKQK